MAAERLVVDAAAALSLVFDEEAGVAVGRAIRQRTSAGARLVVPELFWMEVANTVVGRQDQFDAGLAAIATLDALGVVTVQTDRAAVLATMATMIEHSLTAYDATYLALAEALDAELLTLDRGLAVAAGDRAVPLGRRRVRAPKSTYRLEPWINWSGAADYLEAVRRATV